MKRIYIYPLSSKDDKMGLFNPYIDDLIQSLSEHYDFVNRGKSTGIGLLDIIRYLHRIDYVLFNWIEKIPTLRFGKIQTAFLVVLLKVFKIMGIKVIWTMHNKLSHSGKNPKLTMFIVKLMLKNADIILTHSSEGILYGKELVPKSASKIYYFPHPVKDRRLKGILEKNIDILIWGTMSPYKGIDDFLAYIHEIKFADKYKILIVGKSTDAGYLKKMKEKSNEFIRIQNEFISDENLQKLIASSKTVLFTYSKSSILSSGVLMDSLGYGANIVGPKVGAFADLAKIGIIQSFANYADMITTVDSMLFDNNLIDENNLNEFLEKNSWSEFANNIKNLLS